MIQNLDELLGAAQTAGPLTALVVWPGNDETFAAIRDARQRLPLRFMIAGDGAAIRAALGDAPEIDILDCGDVESALTASVEALSRGQAQILLKGGVDSATLLKAVLRPETRVRTGRLLSDVFVFEYAASDAEKLVMITDGGLNIAPDLQAKVQLIRNAVEVAHALGNANPKVAVLAATEFVQADMPSTLDAAALTQMNERGQIRGCVVDGPLALDTALDRKAADEKRLRSAVAGAADILVCPSIECANAVAKCTTYVGRARLAHVVAGARIPILIPSRADASDAKLFSLALGMIMSGAAARNIGQ